LRRHSYNDQGILNEKGIQAARETGNQIKNFDGIIKYESSLSQRAQETAKYIAEGAEAGQFSCSTDSRLYPFTQKDEQGIKDRVKTEGRETFLDNLINRKTDYHDTLYATASQSVLSYLNDLVTDNPPQVNKRIECISHDFVLHSSLIEILERNGISIDHIIQLGGPSKEMVKKTSRTIYPYSSTEK